MNLPYLVSVTMIKLWQLKQQRTSEETHELTNERQHTHMRNWYMTETALQVSGDRMCDWIDNPEKTPFGKKKVRNTNSGILHPT